MIVNGQRRVLGCKPPEDRHVKLAAANRLAGASFDVTPESKGFKVDDEVSLVDLRLSVGPILDQGQVGRCVWESLWQMINMVRVKYGYPPLDISTLWGYARTRQREGVALSVDGGCTITDAIMLLIASGMCPASMWPNEPAEVRYMLNPPPETDVEAVKRKADNCFSLSSLRWMMASHTLGFPNAVGIQVYESFESIGPDGQVPMPGPGEKLMGAHCMPTCGHSTSHVNLDGTLGALRIPNSWSEGFADHGWIWLPFGYPTFDVWTIHQVIV